MHSGSLQSSKTGRSSRIGVRNDLGSVFPLGTYRKLRLPVPTVHPFKPRGEPNSTLTLCLHRFASPSPMRATRHGTSSSSAPPQPCVPDNANLTAYTLHSEADTVPPEVQCMDAKPQAAARGLTRGGESGSGGGIRDVRGSGSGIGWGSGGMGEFDGATPSLEESQRVAILAAGLGMPSLSLAIDSIHENLVERLCSLGWEVYLFDWRGSPDVIGSTLPGRASTEEIALERAWRYDWPSCVEMVRNLSGCSRPSVFAHGMGAATLIRSLYEGFTPSASVGAVVCSQTSLFVRVSSTHRCNIDYGLHKCFSRGTATRFKPAKPARLGLADWVASCLGSCTRSSYACRNSACRRHTAVLGDIVNHENISESTHSILHHVVPEVTLGLVADVANAAAQNYLGAIMEEMPEPFKMSNLAIPITLISGSENRYISPESVREARDTLSQFNDESLYEVVHADGYGHLDTLIGDNAARDVYPAIVAGLERGLEPP